ncbi:MAG: phospholipase [Bacteroidota bacterium]
MHRFILIALAFSMSISLSAQDMSLYQKKSFKASNGVTLPYRILYPENYNPQKTYPVLFFLHGAGERGDDNELQLVHGSKLFLEAENRKKYNAFVIFPQCAKDSYWAEIDRTEDRKHWEFPLKSTPSPTVMAVMEFFDEMVKTLPIDTRRQYLGGLSMGGFGTFEVLARMPRRFAAAFPICGGGNPLYAPIYGYSTPLWVFHGDVDVVVPVDLSRKVVAALQDMDVDVKYSEYKGVNHNSWDNAFAEPELLKWVFSHKRKKNDIK